MIKSDIGKILHKIHRENLLQQWRTQHQPVVEEVSGVDSALVVEAEAGDAVVDEAVEGGVVPRRERRSGCQ